MEYGKSLMEELLKPLLGADAKKLSSSLAPFLKVTFATGLYGAAPLSGQPFLQWEIEDIATRFLCGNPKARMNRMEKFSGTRSRICVHKVEKMCPISCSSL